MILEQSQSPLGTTATPTPLSRRGLVLGGTDRGVGQDFGQLRVADCQQRLPLPRPLIIFNLTLTDGTWASVSGNVLQPTAALIPSTVFIKQGKTILLKLPVSN